MTASLFADVALAPRDPILGITEGFNADKRPTKVNLGVGVYLNEDGTIPVLQAVRDAEQERLKLSSPRGYLPIDGIAAYDDGVKTLLFGADSTLRKSGRIATVQALGGTGALKIGADFLYQLDPKATVLISDPSWENHQAMFSRAGFAVESYPYYDAATRGVRFAAMSDKLNAAAPRSIVVLHACCHNPTGVDLNADQWREVVKIVGRRNLIPILDFAYQGFAEGIDADALALRLFVESGLDFLVASSFSKSFSLYGERVGALSIVAAEGDQAARILSQLKRTIRTNYSNPPTHGAALVSTILNDAGRRATWEKELGEMRDRIKSMREGLVKGLAERLPGRDFSFVSRQRGMFSYSGLTAAQVDRLREEFAIYALSTGRICVAALNRKNLAYVCDAIGKVAKD